VKTKHDWRVERGSGGLSIDKKCGGFAKGRGGRWATAGKVGESMLTEDRSGVSNNFGAYFASES
jgi:hypothetical protein